MEEIQFFVQLDNHDPKALNNITSYDKLKSEIVNGFSSQNLGYDFELTYEDDEGDTIRITSSLEFDEAASFARKNDSLLILKVANNPNSKPVDVEVKPASQPAPEPDVPLPGDEDEPAPDPIPNKSQPKPDKFIGDLLCALTGVIPGDIEKEIKEELSRPETQEALKQGVNEVQGLLNSEPVKAIFNELTGMASPHSSGSTDPMAGLFSGLSKILQGVVPQQKAPEVPTTVPVAKEAPKEPVQSVVSQPQAVIHDAACDNCSQRIFGVRYKCIQCEDYDLCSACEALNDEGQIHPDHLFAKINKPAQPAAPAQQVSVPEPVKVQEPVEEPKPQEPLPSELELFESMGLITSEARKQEILSLLEIHDNDTGAVLDLLLDE